MKKIETEFEGLYVIEPKVWGDERGFFFETYNAKEYEELGLCANFVQDNYSRSVRGTLRGLHFQEPHAQLKLVRCVKGAVFDVVVDVRKNSKTYAQYFGLELSEDNKKALWIPEGFAHGFYVLSETADFTYKCNRFYSPPHERGLMWDDPLLNIEWPLVSEPILSKKDLQYAPFKNFSGV